jgi:hypothetical protein
MQREVGVGVGYGPELLARAQTGIVFVETDRDTLTCMTKSTGIATQQYWDFISLSPPTYDIGV